MAGQAHGHGSASCHHRCLLGRPHCRARDNTFVKIVCWDSCKWDCSCRVEDLIWHRANEDATMLLVCLSRGNLTITSGALPQTGQSLYAWWLSRIMCPCTTARPPLCISWSANLDRGRDVAKLCRYLLENPGTTAALCLDCACKESLTSYPS